MKRNAERAAGQAEARRVGVDDGEVGEPVAQAGGPGRMQQLIG
jgi:hypothetical protein